MMPQLAEPFHADADGVLVSVTAVEHRDDEYDQAGFETLRRMQADHFWYRGRHRFLLHATRRAVNSIPAERRAAPEAIDLGAGCGGWIAYLNQNAPNLFGNLAMADSSRVALRLAEPIVGPDTPRYQADLLKLGWNERWDVVFLLDVLEHIPEDAAVLREIHRALRPGGFLLVATPALKRFWSYNDTLAHHVRRYSRRDFADLAARTDFELVRSRYFMFFLSPLLVLSRLRAPDIERMTPQEQRKLLDDTHRTPASPLNAALAAVFALETPLGYSFALPWGTSILGVFRKPG